MLRNLSFSSLPAVTFADSLNSVSDCPATLRNRIANLGSWILEAMSTPLAVHSTMPMLPMEGRFFPTVMAVLALVGASLHLSVSAAATNEHPVILSLNAPVVDPIYVLSVEQHPVCHRTESPTTVIDPTFFQNVPALDPILKLAEDEPVLTIDPTYVHSDENYAVLYPIVSRVILIDPTFVHSVANNDRAIFRSADNFPVYAIDPTYILDNGDGASAHDLTEFPVLVIDPTFVQYTGKDDPARLQPTDGYPFIAINPRTIEGHPMLDGQVDPMEGTPWLFIIA